MWASAVVCQGSGQGGERRAEDLEAGRKGCLMIQIKV